MSFGLRDYLRHILAEADFLIQQTRHLDSAATIAVCKRSDEGVARRPRVSDL
ncbi:MAG TPA: hypothetical protein VFX98_02770 [Longimicrobiaceae bacterium]|nr:hypothetical protein [Longimicrobiaceae bacterium]